MELDFDKYKEQQFCDSIECEHYGQIGARIKSRMRQALATEELRGAKKID